MRQPDLFRTPKKPWNAGRIIGPKAPLKPKHIWAIRQQLKASGRRRDLAMFNCAIDARPQAPTHEMIQGRTGFLRDESPRRLRLGRINPGFSSR